MSRLSMAKSQHLNPCLSFKCITLLPKVSALTVTADAQHCYKLAHIFIYSEVYEEDVCVRIYPTSLESHGLCT